MPKRNLRQFVLAIAILCGPLFMAGQNNMGNYQALPQDTLQVRTWVAKAAGLRSGKSDEAISLLKQALSLAEKIGDLPGQATCQVHLGEISIDKNEWAAALSYLGNAKPLLLRLNDETELARVYKLMGDIYYNRINLRQANEYYRESAVLARKTGQNKLLNECQDAMANILVESGRTTGAINMFRRSLSLKTGLNDEKGILRTNLALSHLYISVKNYDSALYFISEVQRLAGTDKEVLTSAAIDQMVIYAYQGKLPEAGQAKTEAEHLLAQRPNAINRVKLLAAITGYHMLRKDNAQVEKYFDSTAALINESRSVEMAAAGLQLLADMSSQAGDYKTAYRMLQSMDKYKDIFRAENMDRISAETRNYAEAGLKEREIEYLNLVNKLRAEQLSKEELKRMALLRENILKDSSLANQRLLMAAMATESELRNRQLEKEKELSLSLSRENELKQKMLVGERKSKKLLWAGLASVTLLGGIIYLQYRRQQKKNNIIRKQSAELEVLNKEIHHRVKNNLQVISSMLDLQSQNLQDEKATAIIKEGIQRVQSMAFIHQNLYQGHAVYGVNMNEYIRMLSNHLFQSYNIRTDKIRLHTQIEELNLHTDTAIPLGMILNELISNALKYAFTGKESGNIWVTMKKKGAELLLQVKDDGRGLPPDFNPETTTSFGYQIITAFAQKMKARINISSQDGTDVQLIISKFKTTA